MTLFLFTGPTLSAADARSELDAVCLPPASEGDVYRAALERPRVIGIIDGYFEAVPAVWHKEILGAMADGIHVFGSASIGALRAAELAPFGMEGVGSIFESFRDGRLQDDDEVAVVHGPAETGYLALSDAMVNIRATLERAAAANVISAGVARDLTAIAKQMHYKERRYEFLLQRAQAAGLPPAELSALGTWLPAGRIDLKRRDALEMLRVIRRRIADALPPKKVAFRFEHTRFWEECSRAAAARGRIAGTGEDGAAAVIEEARLDDRAYRRASKPALARYLAVREARRLDKRPTAADAQETTERFRSERGLDDARVLRRWLDENELDDDALADLLAQESLVAWVGKIVESVRRPELLNELRLSGDYARLARRARDKERLLSAIGAERSAADLHNLTESDLLGWFSHHRGVAADTFVDLAARLGFSDVADLRRALLRERLYAACRESRLRERESTGTVSLDDLPAHQAEIAHPGDRQKKMYAK